MEFTPAERRLLDRAIRVWGVERQWRQAQEECAELIVKINHKMRNRATDDQLIEEIADVLIMVEQAKRMLGNGFASGTPGSSASNRTERMVKKKLERLEHRLDHEEARRAQGLDPKGDEGLVE